jgi:hypothetical protein
MICGQRHAPSALPPRKNEINNNTNAFHEEAGEKHGFGMKN